MSAGFSQNQRSTGGHRPPVQQTKTALRQFCNTLKSAGELPLQFAYLAGIAALTEIPNRRFYYERLLQEIARARRSSSPLTLALVDLDRKSTRLNSSHTVISYAVFCLKKKT